MKMAPSVLTCLSSGSENICRKCKNIPQNGIKCIKCGSSSHPGCLKYVKGVNYLKDNTVICCEGDSSVNSAKDHVEENSEILQASQQGMHPNLLEITYLKQLLAHKDIIINNQNILVNSLQEQIQLMKDASKYSTSISVTPNGISQIPSDDLQLPAEPESKISYLNTPPVNRNTKSVRLTNKSNKNTSSKNSTQNNNNSRSPPHATIATTMRSQPFRNSQQNLSTSVSVAHQEKMRDGAVSKYNTEGKSDKRDLNSRITGTKQTEVVAASKKKWFFVTNYKLDYTKQLFDDYLMTELPANTFYSEQIPSKQGCSSFKLGVDEQFSDLVTNPDFWPNGIQVGQYFFRTYKIQQATRRSTFQRKNSVNR